MKSSAKSIDVPSSIVQNLAIVFIDITGFTKFSLTHSLEDLLRLLRRYMEVAQNVVSSYNPEILEFTGDEILAGFKQAINAYQFVKKLRSDVKPALSEFGLDIRVGIHEGEIMILKVTGSSGVKVRKVIGPTVNIAKKIQTSASLRIHVSNSFKSSLVQDKVKETFISEEDVYGEKIWSIEQ